ncbi:hypothetical protein NL676_004789 [Syzygium grande]|nr:hypothetical protein NL676_004789 [Syzygium grande]
MGPINNPRVQIRSAICGQIDTPKKQAFEAVPSPRPANRPRRRARVGRPAVNRRHVISSGRQLAGENCVGLQI